MDEAKTLANRLLAALQSPTAYRHAVEAVRILETHISWVVLTGQYAYKLKKPVVLGFLDFSTLERRKFYCQEEIRLNQRLAPELYLGVVAIIGTPDAPTVCGDGEAIEFAVQMRQFPQEALLSRVLQRQLLTPAHIDELALQVARFHERIPASPAANLFGGLEQVWKCVAENLEQLATDAEHGDLIEQLKEWSIQEFQLRREAFVARKRQGFIRECHGDMHLGNMLLLDGKIVIFDCVEFNDGFRWIDVLSELAFTIMDFQDRGNPGYAHRVLNAYLELTGDYGGLVVVRYYLVYRALVLRQGSSHPHGAEQRCRLGAVAQRRGRVPQLSPSGVPLYTASSAAADHYARAFRSGKDDAHATTSRGDGRCAHPVRRRT